MLASGSVTVLGVGPGMRRLRPLIQRFSRQMGTVVVPDESLIPIFSEWELGPQLEIVTLNGAMIRTISQSGFRAVGRAPRRLREEAWMAAAHDAEDIRLFRNLRTMPGLAERFDELVTELTDCGIDFGNLAAMDFPASLQNKLTEIHSIVQRGTDLLAGAQQSTQAGLYRQFDTIEKKVGGALQRLMIVLGRDPNPRVISFVDQMRAAGAECWVVTELDNMGKKLFERERAIWSQLGEAVAVESAPCLADSLFSSESTKVETELEVERVTAVDPLAEVEWILRRCQTSLRQGTEPTDIAIFAKNLESYSSLLQDAGRRLGVPVRAGYSVKLLANGFCRLILDVLRAVRSEDPARLMKVLPSSYLRLTIAEIDFLKKSITDIKKEGGNNWAKLGQFLLEQVGFSELLALVEWRQEAIAEPVPLVEWRKRLRNLMGLWDSELLFGSSMTQQRDARAQTAMTRAIGLHSTLNAVDQVSELTLSEFAGICSRAWEREFVTVPGSEYGISVLNRADIVPDVKEVYILGMLEGLFPMRRQENPLLSDYERDLINKALGEAALKTSHEEARGERDEFVRLCAAPSRKLVLSYPLTSMNRDDSVPAFYLTEIERICDVSTVHYPRSEFAPKDEEAGNAYDAGMASALASEKKKPQPLELSDPVREELTLEEDTGYQPRQLVDAFNCPFLFFAKHRLSIHERRVGRLWNLLLRLPRSVSLPLIEHPVVARQTLVEAMEAQIQEFVHLSPENELNGIRSAGMKLIDGWVTREFEARRDCPRTQVRCGISYGEPGLKERPLPDGPRLIGKVDAISEAPDGRPIITLYRPRLPVDIEKPLDELNFAKWRRRTDLLELGLILFAGYPGVKRGLALEIDAAFDQKRVLYEMSEFPLADELPRGGLEAKLILPNHEGKTEVGIFARQVRELESKSYRSILNLEVTPTPSETCLTCSYGELCRGHIEWGERDEEDLFG